MYYQASIGHQCIKVLLLHESRLPPSRTIAATLYYAFCLGSQMYFPNVFVKSIALVCDLRTRPEAKGLCTLLARVSWRILCALLNPPWAMTCTLSWTTSHQWLLNSITDAPGQSSSPVSLALLMLIIFPWCLCLHSVELASFLLLVYDYLSLPSDLLDHV